MSARPTKYIFVTGGVVSALGKGIVAASLGRLLKARGLSVQVQKFDPYLNVDPGTMSPFQHGEVFVTEDGKETDLDIGHYERFVDDEPYGRLLQHPGRDLGDGAAQGAQGRVPGRHRAGHPAHHQRDQAPHPPHRRDHSPTDVVINEIGGTVGDIEWLPFLEAIRQFRREVGQENVLYIHVTLVPFIEAAGELKTKPTQHSVNELRRIGIHPDIVVARSHEPISQDIRDKIALFTDVDREAVIANPDVPDVYLVPTVLKREGLDRLVCEKLRPARAGPTDLGEWNDLVSRIGRLEGEVEIALVGKYVKLQDAYLSVLEALKHGGIHHGCQRARALGRLRRACRSRRRAQELEQVDGVLVPGGFGSRGWEGKILACQVAREQRHPLPRHLPGHARGGLGVRPQRGRHGGRQLDRDGSRDAVPGDRPTARAEGASRTWAAPCASAPAPSSWPREPESAPPTTSRLSTSATATAMR